MDNICKVNLSQFDWYLPQDKKTQYIISITPNGRLNIGSRLLNLIPEYITLGIKKNDALEIILKESDVNGFRPPKSGSIKIPNITRELALRGIALPVRYNMELIDDEGLWLGTMLPSVPAKVIKNKSVSKVRKKGLSSMMPEN